MRIHHAAIAAVLATSVMAGPAAAQIPEIRAAIPNYDQNTLTITGVRFSAQPTVLLGAYTLEIVSASAQLIVARLGGGQLKRFDLDPVQGTVVNPAMTLTSSSRSLLEPEVSPDGTLLVANTRGEARDDIVLLRPDGTQIRMLTNDAAPDRSPRWAPDGRRIAFWSDRGGGTAIFLVNSDGTGLQQVAAPPGEHPCCPVWSPDGRELAYRASDLTIHAIDLSAGPGSARDRMIARLPPGVSFQPVSWSADGSRLAGQERRGNNPRAGVAVYNLLTGEYTRLTDRGGRPIWFSDNRRLLFSDPSLAFVIDTASGRKHQLFSVAPYQNSDLTVSRDGRHLYVSVRANEADVWVATPH